MKTGPSRYSLKGGALAYTLLISLLISLGLGSVMMLWAWNRLEQDGLYYQELAWDNVHSAQNLVLWGEAYGPGSYEEALFESEADSFSAEFGTWGMYGLLAIQAQHGQAKASKVLLIGREVEGIWRSSLFLRDRDRPLTLAGDTRLEGPLYLPQAGLKRGFVGSTGYKGKTLSLGEKRLSKGQLSEADYSELIDLKDWLHEVDQGHFSAFEGFIPDSLGADWLEASRVFSSTSRIDIREQKLSGKAIFIAPEIRVSASSECADILLFAERIYIDNGVKGSLQAFARDSLFCGARIHLSYPSVLAVWHPEGKGALSIGTQSELEGLLLNDAALFGESGDNRGSFTSIGKGSRIFGNVYVPENLDCRGEIHGNVVTGKFILRSPSSYYENHLLDANITQKGLDSSYAMPLLSSSLSPYRILKELK